MAAHGFAPASGQDFFCADTTGRSRSRTGSALSGEEARRFYENVMRDGDKRGQGGSKRASRGNDHHRGHKRTSGASNGRDARRVRAAEVQHQQHQHQSSAAVGRESSRGREDAQRREATTATTTARQTGNPERSVELLGLRFLRCAQEGDTSGLKELLSKEVDINFQDSFFWTAVMCASWSGRRAAVRLLLQRGAAWVGVVDTRGRDAKDLALEAGHSEVLEELESFGGVAQRDTAFDGSGSRAQWCDVCRTTYSSSSQSSHLSSTLHQFSLQHPPPTPYYCLPASSNSYKMMVRCGWTPGTGLGPEGEGPRRPVPTVLKRDHRGLGYGRMKRAKVTHFQARDRDAVKLPSTYREDRGGRGKRNEESRRQEQKDKTWEIDFRNSFFLQ